MRKWTVPVILLCLILLCAGLTACECPHEWSEATCSTPAVCRLCNDIQGEPTDHVWADADCTSPRHCTTCDLTEGKATDHAWVSANCDTPKACTLCGLTDGEALGHFWRSATCTEPQKCDRCDETKGEARGHITTPASCTEASVCTICEQTRAVALGHDCEAATCDEPATCKRCNETSGTALSHQWEGARVCGETRKCKRCRIESAPVAHTWNRRACCDNCEQPIPLDVLKTMLVFRIQESHGSWDDNGGEVFVYHLTCANSAPFDVIIDDGKCTLLGDVSVITIVPQVASIQAETATKDIHITSLKVADNRLITLQKPYTTKGVRLYNLVVDNYNYDYADPTFVIDLLVGTRTYRAEVRMSGTTWARVD